MLVDDFIKQLEQYRGRQIYYQDTEGAFPPADPVLNENRNRGWLRNLSFPDDVLLIES